MPRATRKAKTRRSKTFRKRQQQRGGSNSNEKPTLENVLGIAAATGYKKEVLPTSSALSTRSRSNYLTGLYREKQIKRARDKAHIESALSEILNLYRTYNYQAITSPLGKAELNKQIQKLASFLKKDTLVSVKSLTFLFQKLVTWLKKLSMILKRDKF
jgi:hypothetical protein